MSGRRKEKIILADPGTLRPSAKHRAWQGQLQGAENATNASRQFSQNISANIPTRIGTLARIGTIMPCSNPTSLINRTTRSLVRALVRNESWLRASTSVAVHTSRPRFASPISTVGTAFSFEFILLRNARSREQKAK